MPLSNFLPAALLQVGGCCPKCRVWQSKMRHFAKPLHIALKTNLFLSAFFTNFSGSEVIIISLFLSFYRNFRYL